MNRLRALDGLRGFAILWVLSYHLLALPAKGAAFSGMPGVMAFAGFGWMGVYLFFVLSGYLITLGLVDKPRDRFYFGNFWARRAFRIVPAYALLLVSFVVARASWPAADPAAPRMFNTMIPFWSYPVFAQNFYMASRGYFGNDWLRVLWSLAVEMQFYVVISVALFLIPRRRTAPWLAVLAAGSLAFRYALYFTQAKPEAALVVLLPSRLDGFLLGGLLALMHLGAEADARSRRRLLAGAVLALSVVFLGLYISGKFGSLRVYAAPLYYTVISMAGAALLELCTVRARPVAWVMGSWPLTEAGRLSYFVYLFHMPIALVLFHLALHSAPSLASPRAMAVMAGVCAVIYAAAKLSYVFLEGPLIRYSHTLVRRPPPVPAVAVSPAANS